MTFSNIVLGASGICKSCTFFLILVLLYFSGHLYWTGTLFFCFGAIWTLPPFRLHPPPPPHRCFMTHYRPCDVFCSSGILNFKIFSKLSLLVKINHYSRIFGWCKLLKKRNSVTFNLLEHYISFWNYFAGAWDV